MGDVPATVVTRENQREFRLPNQAGAYRVPIDRTTGSVQLLQRVLTLEPGPGLRLFNRSSEDILYVVRGGGRFEADHRNVRIEDGAALLVPPWTGYRLSNPGPTPLVVLSVLSPPPDTNRVRPQSSGIAWDDPAWRDRVPPVAIHERDERDLPAGDDRRFRLLIDPSRGARNVTQFVGFIERSRAPFHTHTYEEAIYVLDGEGVLHVEGPDGFDGPIAEGSSIFLPPGTSHCLENTSPGVLKVLGVFSPPGSPAMKQEGHVGRPV